MYIYAKPVVVVALARPQSSQPFDFGRQRLFSIVAAASCSKVAVAACVILHNMIVEDEGEMAEQSIDLNAIPRASIVLPPEVQKA